MKHHAYVLALAVILAGCGSSDPDPSGGASGGSDGGTAGTGGTAGGSGMGGTAGDSGTGCTTDCDDGFGCTVDSCVSGKCSHAIGPNTGDTACPAGQYCTQEQGCVSAPVCADVSDCEKAFEGDACKSNIRCDPATSVCLFDILDKDHDSHAPQICGGADCDDGNKDIHPGAAETCDGKDQDCDGVADNDPAASSWCELEEGSTHLCKNGVCACKPENNCSMGCMDILVNPHNCGVCGHECPYLASCENGICECPANTELCGGACMYTESDESNCGACDNVCPTNATCEAGVCVCPDNLTACGQSCVDTMTDPENCSACGTKCDEGDACEQGVCGCPKCGGTECVDLQNDDANCGTCGHSCSYGNCCSTGYCYGCTQG